MRILKIKNKAFTFVELIVASFISSIILTSVFYFISLNVDQIVESNKKTEFFNSIYDFRDKVLYFSNIYNSGTMIMDRETWTWSDVILLTWVNSSDWILIWVVDENIMKLERNNFAYRTYYNKCLWYRNVSWSEISQIMSDPLSVYNLQFFQDKIFPPLKVNDAQFSLYNSWTIINMDLVLSPNYNKSLMWKNWSDLKWEEYYKLNLNF